MTMVERIARVIAKGQGGRVLGEAQAQWFSDNYWPKSVGDAQAVLEVIRNPGQFITMVGNRHFGCHPEDPMAETAWQAMIDAALNEKPQ